MEKNNGDSLTGVVRLVSGAALLLELARHVLHSQAQAIPEDVLDRESGAGQSNNDDEGNGVVKVAVGFTLSRRTLRSMTFRGAYTELSRAAEVEAPTATARSTDSGVVCHTVDESMFLSTTLGGCSAWMSAFHNAWTDHFRTPLPTRGLSHVLATGAHTVGGTDAGAGSHVVDFTVPAGGARLLVSQASPHAQTLHWELVCAGVGANVTVHALGLVQGCGWRKLPWSGECFECSLAQRLRHGVGSDTFVNAGTCDMGKSATFDVNASQGWAYQLQSACLVRCSSACTTTCSNPSFTQVSASSTSDGTAARTQNALQAIYCMALIFDNSHSMLRDKSIRCTLKTSFGACGEMASSDIASNLRRTTAMF